MDPSRSHYATRKSVRDGRASPPTSLHRNSRATSPTSPSSGARQLPKIRPVSSELFYSEVTTGMPRAPVSRGSQTSEVPALTSDVDYDVLNAVESQQDANGPWSPVTRKNSRTHSTRSASPGSVVQAVNSVLRTGLVLLVATSSLLSRHLPLLARRPFLPEIPSIRVRCR
ncbi:hypothetical protein MVEN_00668500 [Mycena venus]|uniref:Uncharacterized protein n=1 Tax=Mycena venus TaxID=2733690 RepID=A0A8H7D6G0_9AGAR|nr:hypothetical protein MVEN_00668500 [Mycena venus]